MVAVLCHCSQRQRLAMSRYSVLRKPELLPGKDNNAENIF